MKRFLKRHERFLSFHHYIDVLRRQPEHMKHVYAVFFAGAITIAIAAVILYMDYGFWHEKYSRSEVVEVNDVETVAEPMVTIVSPSALIGNFFKEASDKVKTIDLTTPKSYLEGKDSYTREGD